jgi:hypothetical protein
MLEFNHSDDIYYFLWGMLFMFIGYSLVITIHKCYPKCKRYIKLQKEDRVLFRSTDYLDSKKLNNNCYVEL